MKTLDEPICADCHFWRDYRDEMTEHPEYDGHCWLKGIMTLWVGECQEHNRWLKVNDGRIEIDYENS